MLKLQWKNICLNNEAIHFARVDTSKLNELYPHHHDFYECFLVEAGVGWHILPYEKGALHKGEIIFMRPEHVHSFQSSTTDPLIITNLSFEKIITENFIKRHKHFIEKAGIWKEEKGISILKLNIHQQSLFFQLIQIFGRGERSELDAEFFLSGLLRIIAPHAKPQEADIPGWLLTAIPIAVEPKNLQKGMSKLVELCGRSPEHISRVFKKVLNQSPTQWLTDKKIKYAQHLLQTTTFSVTEVAFECGYENLSHFHKCFKKLIGDTPYKYRHRSSRQMVGVKIKP